MGNLIPTYRIMEKNAVGGTVDIRSGRAWVQDALAFKAEATGRIRSFQLWSGAAAGSQWYVDIRHNDVYIFGVAESLRLVGATPNAEKLGLDRPVVLGEKIEPRLIIAGFILTLPVECLMITEEGV